MTKRCIRCRRLSATSPCVTCTREVKKVRNSDRTVARNMRNGNYTCWICGKYGSTEDPITLDHKIPLAQGGVSHPSNWAPAHRSCNSRKRDRT